MIFHRNRLLGFTWKVLVVSMCAWSLQWHKESEADIIISTCSIKLDTWYVKHNWNQTNKPLLWLDKVLTNVSYITLWRGQNWLTYNVQFGQLKTWTDQLIFDAHFCSDALKPWLTLCQQLGKTCNCRIILIQHLGRNFADSGRLKIIRIIAAMTPYKYSSIVEALYKYFASNIDQLNTSAY